MNVFLQFLIFFSIKPHTTFKELIGKDFVSPINVNYQFTQHNLDLFLLLLLVCKQFRLLN